jgi:hypothetical protein
MVQYPVDDLLHDPEFGHAGGNGPTKIVLYMNKVC